MGNRLRKFVNLVRRDQERREYTWPLLILVGSLIWSLPPEPRFGIDYFSAIAQVLPVLLVAFFVELLALMRPVREDIDQTPIEPDGRVAERMRELDLWSHRTSRAAITAAFMGEAAALYALANGSTAFLGAACALSTSLVGLGLITLFLARTDPARRKLAT